MHSFDKNKAVEALKKRGWKFDEAMKTWIVPLGLSPTESAKQYEDSLLEAVVCPHEEKPCLSKSS